MVRGLKFEVFGTSNSERRTSGLAVLLGYPAGPEQLMRRSVEFDSSKRAGIRCRTGFNFYLVLSEGGMRRGRRCIEG